MLFDAKHTQHALRRVGASWEGIADWRMAIADWTVQRKFSDWFGFESIGNRQWETGNHGCAASLSFARFSTSAAVTGNHTETHPVNRGTLPV